MFNEALTDLLVTAILIELMRSDSFFAAWKLDLSALFIAGEVLRGMEKLLICPWST